MILLLTAVIALCVSFGTLAYVTTRPWRDKSLLRAFEDLENEFEEFRESARSTLGRVSRLKRDIVSQGVQGQDTGAPDEPAAETALPGMTPAAQRVQQMILRRRMKQ